MFEEYSLIDEPEFQTQEHTSIFDVSAWNICPTFSPNIGFLPSDLVLSSSLTILTIFGCLSPAARNSAFACEIPLQEVIIDRPMQSRPT